MLATGTNQERIEQLRHDLAGGQVWRTDVSDPDTGRQLANLDAAFFDRMMAVNPRAACLQIDPVAQHFNDGASIVITSSTGSVEGSPVASVYFVGFATWLTLPGAGIVRLRLTPQAGLRSAVAPIQRMLSCGEDH